MIGDAAYSLSSTAESEHTFDRPAEPPQDASRARPIPRVNIQAFCEDQDTAAVIEKAAQDRRLAKAHVTVQMGGAQAAVAFFKNASTPNLIIIESLLDRSDMLGELDRLAECCDPGTKVDRHRPYQRRAALSRAAAPRRERICRRSGQGDADHREHLDHLYRPGDGAGGPGHCLRRRQRRLRFEHRLPQHRLRHGLSAEERRGDRRFRPALRHGRPRFQSGSLPGHRRCPDIPRPFRRDGARPVAVALLGSLKPVRRARNARPSLRS